MRSSISSEDDLQIAFTAYAHQHPQIAKHYMHIANERKCSVWQGKHLKRKGVRPGVSDVFIAKTTKNYSGLWIEFKYGKNKLSDNQAHFLVDMCKAGYAIAVCYTLQEAKKVVDDYLNECYMCSHYGLLEKYCDCRLLDDEEMPF
jgi:hypothetical protein